MKELLALGAYVNHVETDGWNALHFAALNGHKDVVELLLVADINVYAETENGRQPKEMAETAGHKEIVDILDKYIAGLVQEL